jgi:SAM-dependent methyltransferase
VTAAVRARVSVCGTLAPMTARDRESIRGYYDELGETEGDRLLRDVAGRVSLEVHRRFLARFVRRGDRVLEVGAGPGRFTAELAALGASVVVTDISPAQLELNREHVGRTDAEQVVERRELLDVCDVRRYGDGEFDLVLAFGGPLSYAFDDAEDALRGLLRVTRPGGTVVASVMSTLGTWRSRLSGVVQVAATVGEDANDRVLATGDLRHLPGAAHVCRMFRAREVGELVTSAGGRLEAISASNWASLGDPAALATLEADPDRWRRFLDHEVAACAEPGTVDGGTHILVAVVHA